jgi:hypothetical protein
MGFRHLANDRQPSHATVSIAAAVAILLVIKHLGILGRCSPGFGGGAHLASNELFLGCRALDD